MTESNLDLDARYDAAIAEFKIQCDRQGLDHLKVLDDFETAITYALNSGASREDILKRIRTLSDNANTAP